MKNNNKLAQSEEKFAAAFKASPDLMSITRISDGMILEVNDGYREILGYTRKESVGKTTRQLNIWANFKDRDKFIDLLNKKGRVNGFETTLKRKDGKLIEVIDSAQVFNFQGEKCVLSVAHDITERKALEQEFKIIFNYSNDGILLVDAKTKKILLANDTFIRMTGYNREEISKMSILSIHPKKDLPLILKQFKDMDGGKFDIAKNIPLQRKDGSIIYVDINNSVVNLGGKRCMLGIFRDVTEDEIKEQKLIESEARFRAILNSTFQFIGFMTTDGRLVEANKTALDFIGQPPHKVIGKYFWETSWWKGNEARVKQLKSAVTQAANGKIIHYQVKLTNKYGKEEMFDFSIKPVFDDHGKVIMLVPEAHNIEEINRKEVELKNQYSLLTSIIETTKDAILIIDSFGGVSFYNQQFLNFWKIPKSLISLNNDKKLLAYVQSQLADAKEFLSKVKYLYQHPELQSIDIIKFKDGRFLERVSLPQKIDSKIVGRVWRFRDITNELIEKNRLINSENHLRVIYENSPIGIVVVGLDKHFISANIAAVKLWGYSERELQKLTFADITHPEEAQRDIEAINKLIAGKIKDYSIEKRYIRKDKKIIYARINVSLVRDAASKPLYFLTSIEDITDHKHWEQTLHESEKKYSALVENSADAVIVLQGGIIKFANKNSEVMTGYRVSELVGSRFIDFVSPKYKKVVAENYKRRTAGEKVNNRYELEVSVKNDGYLPVEINASLLEFEGQPAVMAIIRDISRAKQIDRVKSEFISVASHQLRSPLTGIKWFSQLLADEKVGPLSEKQLDFIQQIYNSNERMIRLVNDLLDVSHIETGQKFSIEKKPGNIITLIHDVVSEQKISSPKKNVNIVFEKKCPNKLVFNFDYDKLYQVFANLINNSIKYSPQGKKIVIGGRCLGDEIEFFVRDFGFGIPRAQQNRVFQKFFRGDNIVTVSTEGTGLGLYIAKNIIEAHGGKMWFESKQNKGTTFYFRLPLKTKK